MKRFLALSMALCLLLAAGCAGKSPESTADTKPANAASTSGELVPGYIPTELPLPDGLSIHEAFELYGWDTCGDTVWLCGQSDSGALMAAGYDTLNDSWQSWDFDTGDARNPYLRAFSAAGDSLWALIQESPSNEELNSGIFPADLAYYVLYRNLADGSASAVRIPFAGDRGSESSSLTFSSLLGLDAGRALLSSYESIYLIDPAVNILGRPEWDIYGNGSHFWVDGQLYMNTREGYAPLDLDTLQFGAPLAVDINGTFNSNAGHFFTDYQRTVCDIDPATGALTERFQWMDVALSYREMGYYCGFENSAGDFFYPAGGKLIKVSQAMLPVKQSLTLACFGRVEEGSNPQSVSYSSTMELMDAVIRFNNTDPEFKIEIKPMAYSSEADRDRLLIELAAASDIDLLDTSFLPDNALDAGLLVDLLPYIDADEAISREDFIQPLLNAMMKDGGLYEYTDKFTLLTMTTHPALFSSRESWTVETIEGLLSQHPEMAPLWHSYDRALVLTLFAWAATAEFIDWETMTCSFDSPAFQNWLRLIGELPDGGEYSEEAKLMDICYDLAGDAGFSTRYPLKDDYVVAGFPETEGTGSYFLKLGSSPNEWRGTSGANTRLGIMAASTHQDAAWRFLRTLMLGEDEPDLSRGIPVFKERFETAVNAAVSTRHDGRYDIDYFNADDAQRLRSQVYNTTKLVHADEPLLTVIRSEANAYISGQKTAEEAARQVQSRLSLYLAEQK